VRDNLETLFGAIDDGALAVRIPRHAREELLAYLDCGLLCRGFARLKCRGCAETRLVAFSCKWPTALRADRVAEKLWCKMGCPGAEADHPIGARSPFASVARGLQRDVYW
jgi:hypothetical protein